MTLDPYEFIRRFLIQVLPKELHRIRHYGRLANGRGRARAVQQIFTTERADPHLFSG